ncbi:MAG: tyrosine-protein phosphatase [Armatimonadetes bacterium]|nr:tyrosine-protein phosphatase [Armatimonadota bacterium]
MAYGPVWVEGLKGWLARSSRPGYPDEDVEPEIVDQWLEKVRQMGIRSIICLLDTSQLSYYSRLPNGLLERYRQAGLEVVHMPITDPTHSPEQGEAELEQRLPAVWEAFKSLPKPVLIHCSAGVQRTGAAVKFIQEQLAEPQTDC